MFKPPCSQPRPARKRGALPWQQSGLALTGVLTFMLALLFTAVAVDTGRIWLQKRNLQKAADMAAMAAARFTGCGSTRADAVKAATDAVQANAPDDGINTTGATTITVERGSYGRNAAKLPVFKADESENNNSARVALIKPVRASLFAGGFLAKNTFDMRAQAVAQGGPPVAQFSVGSLVGATEASAKFTTNLFKAILGNSSLDLGVDALNSLAQDTVTLAQLQVLAGAATIDELLNKDLPLDQLLQWLETTSPTSAAARQALSQLISASAGKSLTVRLGDVLSVHVPADTATASARINLLDLINASILVGAPDGVIKLNTDLLGLGSISLKLGQKPTIALGPAGKSASGAWCTQSQSAQVTLVVGINPLGLGLVDMALRAELAAVNGQLASLNVAPGNTTGVINAGSTLIGLSLTKSKDENKPASLAGGLLTVGLNLPLLEAQGGSATFNVRSTDDLPTGIKTTGTLGQSISGLLGEDTSLDIRVLGLGGDLLKPLVRTIISPILKVVGSGLIEPLLQMLGLNPGFVKVQLQSVQTSLPKLIE
jgi:uncharacterized membrane protein